MTSLLIRLEQATGGDRELDAEIAAALEPHRFDAPGFDVVRPIPPFRLDAERTAIRFDGGGIMCISYFPKYTTSVDAALSLAARVLPGYGIEMASRTDGRHEAIVYPKGAYNASTSFGASLSITLVIAILRAHGGSNDA